MLSNPQIGKAANLEQGGSTVFAFGPFRLDPVRNLLTYGNEVLPLPERLSVILLALVQANGAVVSKEELYELVWPDGGVGENNLSQHVYLLRRLLGERAGDRLYITTVHNKGFRFVAPVRVVQRASTSDEPPAASKPAEDLLLGSGLSAFCHYSRGVRLLQIDCALKLHAARDAFDAALSVHPGYPPALIGLSRTHFNLAMSGYSPPAFEFVRAKHTIAMAMRQDSRSGVARGLLANILLFGDWSWRDAKREIDEAIALSPDSASVRADASWIYQWDGDSERALSEVRRALVNEPASPALQVLFGKALIFAGSYSDCITQISSLVDSDADFTATAYRIRAEAALLEGDAKSAIMDVLMMQVDGVDKATSRLPLLARAYAQNGDVDKAQHIYQTLLKLAKTEYVSHSSLLPVALALDDKVAAVGHFEAATKLREAQLPLLRHFAWFKPLKKEPSFKTFSRALSAT